MSTNTLLRTTRRLGGLAFALLAARARAAELDAPGVSSATMLQMVLALALIVGILFFGAYVLRQINGGPRFGNGGPLRIVGGVLISARERIVLVEVGESWLVIGIVPGQIKTLHTLAKGELPARGGEKPFAQWLKQLTERDNEKQ